MATKLRTLQKRREKKCVFVFCNQDDKNCRIINILTDKMP